MLEKVGDSARKAVKLAEPYKPYGGQFLEFCSISLSTYQTCMKLTRKSTEFCQFFCPHMPNRICRRRGDYFSNNLLNVMYIIVAGRSGFTKRRLSQPPPPPPPKVHTKYNWSICNETYALGNWIAVKPVFAGPFTKRNPVFTGQNFMHQSAVDRKCIPGSSGVLSHQDSFRCTKGVLSGQALL